MKLKQNFSILLLSIFIIFGIYATEKSIILGGEAGWDKSTSVADDLEKTSGLYGWESYHIAVKNHKITDQTDLYLSFENENRTKVTDETGNYSVVEQKLYFSDNAAVGAKCGVSRDSDTLISLLGNKNTIFGKMGPTGSFSIEFWLKPAVCVSGENIFFWRSSKNTSYYSDYQTIEAGFMNGKVEWKFLNVFSDVDAKGYDISLRSTTSIKPEKWSHHYICYDEEEGYIEYYLDGNLEALAYTTDTKNHNGQYLICDLGIPSQIEIGKNYTGSMDEFIISHEVRHYLDTDSRKHGIPTFISKPLKTERNGCKVISVKPTTIVPDQTNLQIFVRAAENAFELLTPETLYTGWTEVKNTFPKDTVKGKYFQVMACFYSDGNWQKSPVLSQLEVKYDEPDLPIPPSKIYTETLNGTVKVSWSNNNLDGQYGYILYYGTKSGSYIGVGLEQGNSPIDCGDKTSIVLSGLEVGKIYYFTVASYLKDYPEIIGETTKEVNARVLK